MFVIMFQNNSEQIYTFQTNETAIFLIEIVLYFTEKDYILNLSYKQEFFFRINTKIHFF